MRRHALRWLGLIPAVVPALVLAIMLGAASPAAAQEQQPDEPEPTVVATGVRAATAPPGVTLVEIYVFVNEILEIDERANTFKVNITLTAEWNDERAIPPDCKPTGPPTVYDGEGAVERLKEDIWSPGFHVREAVGPRATNSVAVSITCDGVVLYEERLATTVTWRYTGLHDFPYDDHRMTFSISPFASSESDNIRFAELYNISPEQDFGSSDWASEEWNYRVRFADQQIDEEQPVLTTVVEIDRKTRYYWLNIIGPLLLIVSISWTVFWMDTNLAERLAVSITILLTVVAFDFLTSDNLPRLSYTTRLDMFYNASYLIVSLTILVSIIAARRAAHRGIAASDGAVADPTMDADNPPATPPSKKPADSRLDVWSRGLFPAVYVLCVAAALLGFVSRGPGATVVATDEDRAGEMGAEAQAALETIEAVTELQLDEFMDAEIDDIGEVDEYKLCNQDGTVAVRMTRRGGENDLLDPFLAVYDGNGNVVAADDDGAGGLDSLATFDAKPDMCYLVVASDADQDTGAYRITVSINDAGPEMFVDFDNVTADFGLTIDELHEMSSTLEPDVAVTGSISESGEFDVYQVCPSASDGESLTVTMSRAPASDDLDPFLTVYSADGSYEDADDDRAGGVDSLVLIETDPALPDVCHFVIASDLEDGTGEYVVEATFDSAALSDVELEFGNPFEELFDGAVDLPLDEQPMSGEFQPVDEPDFYRFCVGSGDDIAGGPLEVIVSRADPTGPLDPAILIYSDDGSIIAFDDDGAGGLDSRIALDALESGCYLLATFDVGGSTGAYDLSTFVD